MLNTRFKTEWVNLESTSTILLLLFSFSGFCAEIDFAVENLSEQVMGLKIEGEIVKGDSDKLLELLKFTGPTHMPVFLDSKGGDVLEAMKIGKIFRRLKLRSTVPYYYPGLKPVCGPKLSDPTNCVCASACFLIHAGAVDRAGNLLALHRPYLSASAASKITDTQHEADQKEVMTNVKKYLDEMEVPTYFTNLMMSKNSQDAHIVSLDEASEESHLIVGYVPSVEEITLSKCKISTERDYASAAAITRKGSSASKGEQALLKRLNEDSFKGSACQVDVVYAMRVEAFTREFGEVWAKYWRSK